MFLAAWLVLRLLKKWENNHSCDLEKEIHCGKVVKLRCKLRCKYESRITSIKGLSRSWIEGTDSVKKGSLMKHINGDWRKYAIELQRKETV